MHTKTHQADKQPRPPISYQQFARKLIGLKVDVKWETFRLLETLEWASFASAYRLGGRSTRVLMVHALMLVLRVSVESGIRAVLLPAIWPSADEFSFNLTLVATMLSSLMLLL